MLNQRIGLQGFSYLNGKMLACRIANPRITHLFFDQLFIGLWRCCLILSWIDHTDGVDVGRAECHHHRQRKTKKQNAQKVKMLTLERHFDQHMKYVYSTLSVIVEIRLRNQKKRPTAANSSGIGFHVDRRPILYLENESLDGSRTTWWPWGFGCDDGQMLLYTA